MAMVEANEYPRLCEFINESAEKLAKLLSTAASPRPIKSCALLFKRNAFTLPIAAGSILIFK